MFTSNYLSGKVDIRTNLDGRYFDTFITKFC